jgi:hypothetical protein
MRKYPSESQKKFIQWVLDTQYKSVPQAELNTLKSVLTEGYAISSKGLNYRRQGILNKLRAAHLKDYQFYLHYTKLATYYDNAYLVKEI